MAQLAVQFNLVHQCNFGLFSVYRLFVNLFHCELLPRLQISALVDDGLAARPKLSATFPLAHGFSTVRCSVGL